MSKSLDPRTAQSDELAKLRDRPRLAENVNPSKKHRREFVATLKAPTSSSGAAHSYPGLSQSRSIQYLVGDERRAIRLFIETNRELVAVVFRRNAVWAVFGDAWDDMLIHLLEEEWAFEQAQEGSDE